MIRNDDSENCRFRDRLYLCRSRGNAPGLESIHWPTMERAFTEPESSPPDNSAPGKVLRCRDAPVGAIRESAGIFTRSTSAIYQRVRRWV
jgi:hypothetical protein